MTPLATWTERIGQRVVVRYLTPEGDQNDLVGDLLAVDACLHVLSKRGRVEVALERVLTGKVVPPRPTRPGPPHLVLSITDLQRVMSLHWQALETERLGGWLLRASAGFTGRANSAIAFEDPARHYRRPRPDRRLGTATEGCRRSCRSPTTQDRRSLRVDPDAGPRRGRPQGGDGLGLADSSTTIPPLS